jgi:hypothetical protein
VTDARAFLDEAAARRFLGWTEAAPLPDEAALVDGARRIVEHNRALWRRQSKLGQPGLLVSPIWEPDGDTLVARLAVLPEGFVGRYYAGEAAECLDDDDLLALVAELFPILASDPVGAAFALGDVHRVWYDETGPRRAVVGLEGAHLRFLSMLLADVARKLASGLDELEWMSTLGLPVEELVDELDRPADRIARDARTKTEAMWAEEAAWVRAAYGLSGGPRT